MKTKIILWLVIIAALVSLGATGTALYYKTGDAARSSVDIGMPALVIMDSSPGAPTGVVDGDYTTLQVNATGELHIYDADSATIAGAIKAEDAAHTTADTGVMLLTVRDDTPPASTGAAGDYVPLLTNATGELYTVDTAGNAILTTIDSDTNDIKTAVQIIDGFNESLGQTIVYTDIPANATEAGVAEEILAAVVDKKIYILELVLTFTVQDVARVLNTTATPVYLGSYQIASYGGIVLPRNATDKPHFVTSAVNVNFGISTAAINSYSGHIIYYTAP